MVLTVRSVSPIMQLSLVSLLSYLQCSSRRVCVQVGTIAYFPSANRKHLGIISVQGTTRKQKTVVNTLFVPCDAISWFSKGV